MKPSVLRQVKSSFTALDAVGNALLVKFTYADDKASVVIFPGSIVLWLLRHIPVAQDPSLVQPPTPQPLYEQEWYAPGTPRALSVQCKQFVDGIRMHIETDAKPDLSLLIDAANLELLRQVFTMHAGQLVDLDGL